MSETVRERETETERFEREVLREGEEKKEKGFPCIKRRTDDEKRGREREREKMKTKLTMWCFTIRK